MDSSETFETFMGYVAGLWVVAAFVHTVTGSLPTKFFLAVCLWLAIFETVKRLTGVPDRE